MKPVLLSILLFSLSLSLSAQKANDAESSGLSLVGMVKKIEAEKVARKGISYPYYETTVIVAATLTNSGTRAIILLDKKPDLKRAILSKAGYKSPNEGSDNLAEYLGWYYASSEFMDAKRWAALTENYDKPSPPSHLTHTLQPGDSLDFETVFSFRLPVTFEYEGFGFLKPQSFSFIKQISPVELTLEYRTWSTVSLSKEYEGKSRKFIAKLRKRWKSEGDLTTENITVKSIPIDFNSAKLAAN